MSNTPDKAAFTQKLLNACDVAKPLVTAKTKLLVTAHAAYESGWGVAKAAREGNNYWNLTAGKSWTGPVVIGGDTSFQAGSTKATPIVQRFRSYASAVAGVQDYFNFMTFNRYRDALTKLFAGDESFVVDLGMFKHTADGKTLEPAWPALPVKGGFYTLPIEQYSAEFKVIFAEVKRLDGVCA